MKLGCDLGICFSINVNMLVTRDMMKSSCLLQQALMMSTISVVILGAADINDVRGYYHCSDRPNFVCGYCENHPQR
jgi:hypothetical protein